MAAAALGDAPVDQPGAPVRGRDRHDRGAQIFDQAYVGASIASGSASSAGDPSNDLGYPEDSTLFYPVLLFQQGFRFFNMGYAAAMAVLLLVVSFAITMLIVRNSRRWVHYAAGR